MSRPVFVVMVLLSVSAIALCLHRRHAATRLHPSASALAHRVSPAEAKCGCEPPVPIPRMPNTSQGWRVWRRQQRQWAEQEQRQDSVIDRRVALRLHKLVRTGMSRRQVEHLMGTADMQGLFSHPVPQARDADFYAGGDYEVAYSAGGSVVWVGLSRF